jgi:predicted enzyme related to lactoylglutathione lyase
MSIKVKEVAFIFHPVSDIARARQFYEGLLGLKAEMQAEFGAGTWWIEYDVGGTALAVSNVSPPSGEAGAVLALEVADLDASLAAVRAAGVPVTLDVQEFPPCRMFEVKTADGHKVMLHQRKP